MQVHLVSLCVCANRLHVTQWGQQWTKSIRISIENGPLLSSLNHVLWSVLNRCGNENDCWSSRCNCPLFSIVVRIRLSRGFWIRSSHSTTSFGELSNRSLSKSSSYYWYVFCSVFSFTQCQVHWPIDLRVFCNLSLLIPLKCVNKCAKDLITYE